MQLKQMQELLDEICTQYIRDRPQQQRFGFWAQHGLAQVAAFQAGPLRTCQSADDLCLNISLMNLEPFSLRCRDILINHLEISWNDIDGLVTEQLTTPYFVDEAENQIIDLLIRDRLDAIQLRDSSVKYIKLGQI